MVMLITSDSFKPNDYIPKKYSGYGDDVNPTLMISDIPKETKTLALIVEDPDSPGRVWQHWLIWNIPPETKVIEENSVPNGAVQGLTDFGQAKYGGPMPHADTHHYHFKLYALNKTLDLPEESSRAQLDEAMKGAVIDLSEIVGLYSAPM